MAIELGERRLRFFKRLSQARFFRDTDGALDVRYAYQTGYSNDDGEFVSTDERRQMLTPSQAAFVLDLRASQSQHDDPTLGQMLVEIFDAIEAGALPLPDQDLGDA